MRYKGYDSMVLHSLRTDAGISLSVVEEFLSISSMASIMSYGEKETSLIFDGDDGWHGKVLLAF